MERESPTLMDQSNFDIIFNAVLNSGGDKGDYRHPLKGLGKNVPCLAVKAFCVKHFQTQM